MKKLLMLAFAAVALTVPASASAAALDGSTFRHENNTVPAPTEILITGTMAFTANGNEVHCPMIHAVLDLKTQGTGTAKTFSCTEGKVNGIIDFGMEPISIHEWIVEARGTDEIVIRNLTIHQTFTFGGSCLLTRTLAGTVRATLLNDSLNTHTAELFNKAGEFLYGEMEVSIFGDVSFTDTAGATTDIGVE